MNTGKACAIFKQIDSDKYSDAEKLEAVREVVEMPTHNGVTKATMLTVLRWFAENTKPVVHGEWIPNGMHPNGVVGNWECSVCGGVSLEDSDYCPSCNAKMDGGSDEKV